MQPSKSPHWSNPGSVKSFFWQSLAEEKQRIVHMVIALLVLSLSQVVFVFLVGPLLKVIFISPDSGFISLADMLPSGILNFVPQSIKDLSIPPSVLAVWVPCLIVVVGAMRSVARYFYQLGQEILSINIASRYREILFAKIVSQSYLDISKRQAGEWMSMIMNDVVYLQMRFSQISSTFIRDTVLILSCFLALWFIHWPTAATVLIVSPLFVLGLGRLSKRISFFAEKWQNELAKISSFILNLRVRFNFIRGQRGEMFELEKFRELNFGYYTVIRRSILLRSAFAPLQEFLGFSLFAGLLFYMTRSGSKIILDPLELVQVFVALGLLLKPLKDLGEQLTKFQETKGSLMQGSAFFSQESVIHHQAHEKVALRSIERIFFINQLQLKYGNQLAFEADGLVFEMGKAYAVVGPSGAGKSSLVRCLAGLMAPFAWDANLSWKEATSCAVFVSQQPFMFKDSLRNNLIYGLDRKIIDDEILSVLRKVGLFDLVAELPDQLGTICDTLTVNFSGGQIQRFVIARALLSHKPYLLLDEATSAIDLKTEIDLTERLITEAQSNLSGGARMIIAVTHRMHLLSRYDEIIFVENGKISFQGSHSSLLLIDRYKAYCDHELN